MLHLLKPPKSKACQMSKQEETNQSHHQPLCSEQQTPPLLRHHGPVPVPTLPEGGRRAGRPAPIAAQVRHGRVGPGPVRRVSSAALVQGKNYFVLAMIYFAENMPLWNHRRWIGGRGCVYWRQLGCGGWRARPTAHRWEPVISSSTLCACFCVGGII